MDSIREIERLEINFEQFIDQGEALVERAFLGETENACLLENSLICCAAFEAKPAVDTILAIDIGGTNVKAGLAQRYLSNRPDWRLLFDLPNAELSKRGTGTRPIESFATNLSLTIQDALKGLSLDRKIQGVGVVWSNAVESRQLDSCSVSGVTGLVSGVAQGTYRKDEWFIQDLSDGYDLGALFLSELKSVDIAPERFLVANDTIFTLTATPGAHAGVVASSGANCTLTGTSSSERREIFNSELGSIYKIPHNLLSAGDAFLGSEIALEDLISGKWLPRLLKAHISRESELDLNGIDFNPHDISGIIRGIPLRTEIRECIKDLALTQTVAKALIRRAAHAAAGLCFFSICNQIESGVKRFKISLDSAMARNIPGYAVELESIFSKLMKRRNCLASIELREPLQLDEQNTISVPLIGAANAVAYSRGTFGDSGADIRD